jgi:hypothetical protein
MRKLLRELRREFPDAKIATTGGQSLPNRLTQRPCRDRVDYTERSKRHAHRTRRRRQLQRGQEQ